MMRSFQRQGGQPVFFGRFGERCQRAPVCQGRVPQIPVAVQHYGRSLRQRWIRIAFYFAAAKRGDVSGDAEQTVRV